MADSKKYDGSQWEHSLRKYTTAAEIVENPLYSDGTAITSYTLKGNTTTSGTPSPSNPVMPNGVGERTANLIEGVISNSVINTSGVIEASQTYSTMYAPVTSGETYTFAYSASGIDVNYIYGLFATLPKSGSITYDNSRVVVSYSTSPTITLTIPSGVSYIGMRIPNAALTTGKGIMINQGSEVATYEPWGYKIPISTLQGSAVNYLGSVQSTRQIYKFVLTGNETYTYDSAYTRFNFLANNLKFEGIRLTPLLCTHYEVVDDGRSIGNVPNNAIYAGGSTSIPSLYIKTDAYTTETDFKAYLAQQYAAGTPVTVWYVLQTATTGIVNEPLMKIGTYADSISNAVAIPTTEGANSITVDTTVQPSEFTATWTGWHDSSVKEYTGGAGNQKFDYMHTEGLLTGVYINQQGQTVENPSYDMSDFIEVQPNTEYTWNFGSTVSHSAPTVAYYDSSKTYISVASHAGSTYFSFTTPNNCAFIRVPIYVHNKQQAMLNLGSEPMPYESYEYGWV